MIKAYYLRTRAHSKAMNRHENAKVSELWRVVDTTLPWKPTWINGSDPKVLRLYGACDAKLVLEGDVLRFTLQRAGSWFVLIFGALFLPFMVGLTLFSGHDLQLRILFALLSLLVGGATFGLLYAVCRYHERLGDYLAINRSLETIRLPRQNLEFPFSQVVGFQWVCGPVEDVEEIRYDVNLNVLVRQSDSIIRYNVMGDPSRIMVEEMLLFSGMSLDEYQLERLGDIYRDANST